MAIARKSGKAGNNIYWLINARSPLNIQGIRAFMRLRKNVATQTIRKSGTSTEMGNCVLIKLFCSVKVGGYFNVDIPHITAYTETEPRDEYSRASSL